MYYLIIIATILYLLNFLHHYRKIKPQSIQDTILLFFTPPALYLILIYCLAATAIDKLKGK